MYRSSFLGFSGTKIPALQAEKTVSHRCMNRFTVNTDVKYSPHVMQTFDKQLKVHLSKYFTNSVTNER